MPFKQLVSQHTDRSESPNSAINTVVNYSGLLVGYNCDYLGLKEVLGDKLKDQTVVVLGDGAMAENVIMLSDQAHNIIQISRRKNNWDQRHTNCDVLINTTSIGMGTDQSPVDFINAHTVIDCVIGKTSLVKQAQEKNKQVVTGADIYQAQFKHQFKLYTHREPDSAIVSSVAKRVFE
jgi:shikimate dehydrogenase